VIRCVVGLELAYKQRRGSKAKSSVNQTASLSL
jgi:hypothetical protein